MAAMMSFALFGFNFVKADEIATISLDGQFEDWKDVPTLLTNVETWYPNFKGQTYYWNNDTDSWQTTELPNACMYNEGRALDLGKIKFANDTNYLYFYWEKNSDYMNYFWKTFPDSTDPDKMNTIDEQGFTSTPVTKYSDVAQSEPPCLGETIYNPVTYNHDMVFSFDTNLDNKADYYLILNIIAPQGTPGSAYQYSVFSYIYKDNGNGIYDGMLSEIGVVTLGDYAQFPSATACQNGVCQEGRIKINTVFTDLGLKWGSSILVNYEAHSSTKLFSTAKALYSFNKSNKLGLKILQPKKKTQTTKKKSIVFQGKVKKESKVTIYLNKKKVYQSQLAGTFSELAPLKKGVNTIVVKAQKGKQKVTMGVVVVKKK